MQIETSNALHQDCREILEQLPVLIQKKQLDHLKDTLNDLLIIARDDELLNATILREILDGVLIPLEFLYSSNEIKSANRFCQDVLKLTKNAQFYELRIKFLLQMSVLQVPLDEAWNFLGYSAQRFALEAYALSLQHNFPEIRFDIEEHLTHLDSVFRKAQLQEITAYKQQQWINELVVALPLSLKTKTRNLLKNINWKEAQLTHPFLEEIRQHFEKITNLMQFKQSLETAILASDHLLIIQQPAWAYACCDSLQNVWDKRKKQLKGSVGEKKEITSKLHRWRLAIGKVRNQPELRINNFPSYIEKRQALQQIRDQYQLPSTVAEFQTYQKNLSAVLKSFYKSYLQETEQFLGTAPCSYVVMARGSTARNEMTLYSDLECSIVFERELAVEELAYFKVLFAIFHFSIGMLGETGESLLPAGVRLDLNAMTEEGKLYGSKTEWLKKLVAEHNTQTYIVEEGLGISLLSSTYFYGDESLYGKLTNELHQALTQQHQLHTPFNYAQYRVLEQVLSTGGHLEDIKDILIGTKESLVNQIFSIKKPYLNRINYMLADLAILYGLYDNNQLLIKSDCIINRLTDKGVFTESQANELKQAILYLNYLCAKVYAHNPQHGQLAQAAGPKYMADSTLQPCYELQADEFNQFENICQIVMVSLACIFVQQIAAQYHPLEQKPLKWGETDLAKITESWLNSDSATSAVGRFRLVKGLLMNLAYLSHRNAPPADYRTLFMQLKASSSLRAVARQWIKTFTMPSAAVYDTIANVPDEDGKRYPLVPPVSNFKHLLNQLVAENEFTLKWLALEGQEQYVAQTVTSAIWDPVRQKRLPSTLPGNHDVYAIPNKENAVVYLKFRPESAATDLAVSRLYYRIMGGGAALSCFSVLKLNKALEPVLISQAIPGEMLGEVFDNNPDILQQLDPKQLSQQLLIAILLNQEDAKPENIIVQPIKNAQDQIIHYHLINIDNERAFFNPVMPKKGWVTNYSVLSVKNILFCFNQMQKPLHPEVIEEFLLLNPSQVLESWLLELEQETESYEKIKQRLGKAGVSQFGNDSVNLDLSLQEGFAEKLYYKIWYLQKVLREDTEITPIQLLERLEPQLAKYYRSVLNEEKLTPAKRFDKLVKREELYPKANSKGKHPTKPYQTLLLSLQSSQWLSPQQALQALENFRTHLPLTQLQAAHLALLQGEVAEFQKLSQDNKARVIKQLKFTPFVEAKIGHLLRAELRKGGYRTLVLKNVSLLTDSFLTEIVRSNTELQYLEIGDCQRITSAGMSAIAKYCNNLQTLILTELPEVKDITGIEFNQLKSLQIKACNHLTQIRVKAAQLQTLLIEQCDRLGSARTRSLELKRAKLKKCKALTTAGIYRLADKCNLLEELVLENCGRVKHSEELQNHPILLSIPLHMLLGRERSISDYQLVFLNLLYGFNNITKELQENTGAKETKETKETDTFKFTVDPSEANFFNKLKTTARPSLINIFVKCANNQYRSICLDGSDVVGDIEAEAFGVILKHNNTLEELDLSRSHERIAEFKLALQINLSLYEDSFLPTYITARGTAALAEMLPKNTTLKVLKLNCQKVGDKGAIALANMLANNKSVLEVLEMANSNIGNEGCWSIAQALKTNTYLRRLDLSGGLVKDYIKFKGLQGLAEMLQFNCTLNYLALTNQSAMTAEIAKFFIGIIDCRTTPIVIKNTYSDQKALKARQLALSKTTTEELDKKVEQLCIEVFKLDPQQPIALNVMCFIYQRCNQHEQAVACCEQILAVVDSSSKATAADTAYIYEAKAESLIELERYQEAVETYEQLTALVPNEASYFALKGNALTGLGKYQSACVAYEHAALIAYEHSVELASRSAYYCNWATALEMQGKYQEAFKCYEQALQLDGDNKAACYGKLITLLLLDEYQRAFDICSTILAKEPENARIRYYLAIAFHNLHNIKVDGSYLPKSDTIEPVDSFFIELGWYYLSRRNTSTLDNVKQALVCAEYAIQYNACLSEAYQLLAILYKSGLGFAKDGSMNYAYLLEALVHQTADENLLLELAEHYYRNANVLSHKYYAAVLLTKLTMSSKHDGTLGLAYYYMARIWDVESTYYYEQSLFHLEKRAQAKQNNISSRFFLGKMYEKGYGVASNLRKASAYYIQITYIEAEPLYQAVYQRKAQQRLRRLIGNSIDSFSTSISAIEEPYKEKIAANKETNEQKIVDTVIYPTLLRMLSGSDRWQQVQATFILSLLGKTPSSEQPNLKPDQQHSPAITQFRQGLFASLNNRITLNQAHNNQTYGELDTKDVIICHEQRSSITF